MPRNLTRRGFTVDSLAAALSAARCTRHPLRYEPLAGRHGLSRYLPTVTNTRHGTSAGWHSDCRCTPCRQAHNDTQRALGRARAQQRLPAEVRQQLLDAIYAGRPFRNGRGGTEPDTQSGVGLAKTDEPWSKALKEALTATRRDDLEHGTNAAYGAGCLCRDCREHQRQRIARNR